eukprot:COSAG01_NODE_22159_length_868_cov_310.209363_1_plen_34_part_10
MLLLLLLLHAGCCTASYAAPLRCCGPRTGGQCKL